ncbi:zinc finger protein 135 isoform X2 [Cryptotermes secundus]|uniref:zinc finger protein 135 isoform X2 n=1 Tax=Cryptotermes secundus TaxID=105785 RepID=UPI000CD7CD47|nr:zinc finger protein 135 isoform X2 [Cryptotermes secundus]XP_023714942.1 zinc finger protein 135 isoform X2 [Cryptotermes secundus]XP_033608965.1 zinc finger protein 135 isoform X2 [Cryptotermes secundus]
MFIMNVIKVEPDLGSGRGSLFLHRDIQLTATQQADIALVEVIAPQQKGIQKTENKLDAVPVSATLSVKSEGKEELQNVTSIREESSDKGSSEDYGVYPGSVEVLISQQEMSDSDCSPALLSVFPEIPKRNTDASSSNGSVNVSRECHNATKKSQLKHYRCAECNKEFSKLGNLKLHIGKHTGEHPYKCKICSKTFIIIGSLVRHKCIDAGDKCYSCQLCDGIFSDMESLAHHSRSHLVDKPYNCGMCDKTFADSGNLAKHKRTHTGEKPYSCDICDKAFSRSENLTRHRRIHSGEKCFTCEICEKSFSRSENLAKHTRTHTVEKSYSGENDMHFLHRESLEVLDKSNVSAKRYKCGICNKRFSDSGNRAKHIRTHTGEKPYSCIVCNKHFSRSENLLRHSRIHTGEKSYSCEMCKKSFSRKENLDKHRRSHTEQTS